MTKYKTKDGLFLKATNNEFVSRNYVFLFAFADFDIDFYLELKVLPISHRIFSGRKKSRKTNKSIDASHGLQRDVISRQT